MARYIILKNTITGNMLIIDTWKKRRRRMQLKIAKWAEIIKEMMKGGEYKMVTLTYDRGGVLGESHDWSPNDVRDFIIKMRTELKEKLWAYAWVAEVHEKGGVHYHVLMYVEEGCYIPYPDRTKIWDKGMTNLITDVKSGGFYLLSYASKHKQKDFGKYPKGARVFGIWMKDKLLLKEVSNSVKNPMDALYEAEGWDKEKGYAYIGSALGHEYAVMLAEGEEDGEYLDDGNWGIDNSDDLL